MNQGFKFVAVAAARALSEKKAEDVALLNVGRTSPITDYLLIVTAMSRPHLESLEVEADKATADFGISALHRAKPKSDSWRVIDYGGLLVHLMTAETRDLYALEKLYPDARHLTWRAATAAAAPSKTERTRKKK